MSATKLHAALLVLATFLGTISCQTAITIMIVIEEPDEPLKNVINEAVPLAEKNFGDDVILVNISLVIVDRVNIAASFEKACEAFFKGVTIVLDMTWTGWGKLRTVADENGIIYKRGDSKITSFVQAIDDLLMMKNATDVGLIFEDERELNQSLYYLIGNSIVRLVVIDEFTEKTVSKIRSMRPSPSYYAIYASTSKMDELFKTAVQGGLVKRDGIWNLVFTDNNYKESKYIDGEMPLNVSVTVLMTRTEVCCRLMGEPSCTCPSDVEVNDNFWRNTL